MRSFVMVLVVVGLLAAPSLGLVNVRIVPSQTQLNVGEQTVVAIEVGTGEVGVGVYALSGSVIPSAAGVLANVGDLTFDPAYRAAPSFPYTVGTAGNGGVAGFGSVRTGATTTDDHGDLEWVPFATYTVVGASLGTVELNFVEGLYGGWLPLDSNGNGLGTVTSGTITVVPEPTTMALLALGGLLIARRRRA